MEGIASAEAFGSPEVHAEQQVGAGGISSAETFGQASIIARFVLDFADGQPGNPLVLGAGDVRSVSSFGVVQDAPDAIASDWSLRLKGHGTTYGTEWRADLTLEVPDGGATVSYWRKLSRLHRNYHFQFLVDGVARETVNHASETSLRGHPGRVAWHGRKNIVPGRGDDASSVDIYPLESTYSVQIPHQPALVSTGAFAVEIWHQPDENPPASPPSGGQGGILAIKGNVTGWSGYNFTGTDYEFIFYYTANQTLRFVTVNGSNVVDTYEVPWTWSAGTTYHMVAVWDGATKRIIVNGVEQGSGKAWSGPRKSTSHPLSFGGHEPLSTYDWGVPGLIQEPAYYLQNLSMSRIQQHHSVGATLSLTDIYTAEVLADSPIGFWHLDESWAEYYFKDVVGVVGPGLSDWQQISFPLAAGTRVLRWTYKSFQTGSGGPWPDSVNVAGIEVDRVVGPPPIHVTGNEHRTWDFEDGEGPTGWQWGTDLADWVWNPQHLEASTPEEVREGRWIDSTRWSSSGTKSVRTTNEGWDRTREHENPGGQDYWGDISPLQWLDYTMDLPEQGAIRFNVRMYDWYGWNDTFSVYLDGTEVEWMQVDSFPEEGGSTGVDQWGDEIDRWATRVIALVIPSGVHTLRIEYWRDSWPPISPPFTGPDDPNYWGGDPQFKNGAYLDDVLIPWAVIPGLTSVTSQFVTSYSVRMNAQNNHWTYWAVDVDGHLEVVTGNAARGRTLVPREADELVYQGRESGKTFYV